jgi:hypothetical protein
LYGIFAKLAFVIIYGPKDNKGIKSGISKVLV